MARDREIGTSVTLGPLAAPLATSAVGCAWIAPDRDGGHRVYVLLEEPPEPRERPEPHAGDVVRIGPLLLPGTPEGGLVRLVSVRPDRHGWALIRYVDRAGGPILTGYLPLHEIRHER